MQFRIITKNPVTKTQILAFSIQDAKMRIIAFRFGAEEILIDNMLKTKYKTGLKPTCLNLLNKLQAHQVSDTEILFTFIDEEADKLASFISYGDGNLSGSKILIQALTHRAKGV